jgi:hypothetical protein
MDFLQGMSHRQISSLLPTQSPEMLLIKSYMIETAIKYRKRHECRGNYFRLKIYFSIDIMWTAVSPQI